MYALTIKQPWADAIASGRKPVENRTWAPPSFLVGQELAIHAAARPDALGFPRYRALLPDDARSLEDMPHGGVVAVARVVGALHLPSGKILGALSPEQVAGIVASPWTSGPWCWLLADVVRLPFPVACRGTQNVWQLDGPTCATVLDALQGRG